MAAGLLISEDRFLIILSILLSAILSLTLLLILITAFVVIWKLVCKNEKISETVTRITSAMQSSVSADTMYSLLPREALVEHEPLLVNSAQEEEVFRMPTTQMNRFTNYSAQEVKRFTNNFAEENEIGRGGSGTVFKGKLRCGKRIAVKKLNASQAWSRGVLWAEVEAISRTHHKHVVDLMGCCWESQCLVYEYVPNGTLATHLRKQGNPRKHESMSWVTRRQIAIQCAHALAYLHHFCTPTIVHRDVKSGNILLNDNYEAKIADFGLAKVMEKTHMTTSPGGTFGYMSPRHVFNTRATTKSDVYSFGVVLLELITGMPALLPQKNGICSLVSLVIQSLENNPLITFLDPSLEASLDRKELSNMIMAAMGCLNNEVEDRPTMLQVSQLLEHGIGFPPCILQTYDQHIISKLSNLVSIVDQSIGGSIMNDNVLPTPQCNDDDYQPICSFEDHFDNEEPLHLRSMMLSQRKLDIESCGSRSNESSFVDAYSLLSTLTFSRIGSIDEGIELQQGDGGSFNHALHLDVNDPVFGNCYNRNHQDQHYSNSFEDSRASTTPNFACNQSDPIWNIASIQEWNQKSSICESR